MTLAACAALAALTTGGLRVVALEASGPPDAVATFVASTRAQAATLPVQLRVGTSEGAWASLTLSVGEAEASLTLRAEGAAPSTRRLSGPPGLTAEAAAQVVATWLEGLLAQPAPAVAVEAPVAPSPAEPRPAPLALELAVAAGGRWLAPVAFTVGAIGLVGLQLPSRRVGLALGAAWSPAVEVASLTLEGPGGQPGTGEALQLRLSQVTARLSAVVELVRAGPLQLDLAVGGGVEVHAPIATVGGQPPPRQRPPTLAASPLATAALWAHVRLSSQVRLFVSAGTDVDLQPPRFVARAGDAREVLFESPRLRPALLLGLSLTPSEGAR